MRKQFGPHIVCLSPSFLSACLLLPLAGFAQVAVPPSSPSPGLEKDTRLERKISLNRTGLPLEELLRSLSVPSCPLTCDRACASLKLQASLRERPLRQVMQSLAELVPGIWQMSADERGYRLEMDEKAAMRRDRWWRLFLRERERAIAVQRARVLQQMRARPDSRDTFSDEQTKTAVQEGQGFFGSLPASLQEHIADRMTDIAYYKLGPIYLANPYVDEGTAQIRLRDLPVPLQEMVRNRLNPFLKQNGDGAGGENGVIRFSNAGWQVLPSLVMPDGKWASLGCHLSVGFAPESTALPLDQSRLLKETQRLGRAAPEAWKQLAAYQKSVVWQNSLPEKTVRPLFPPRRAELLAWLADRTEMEFIADYYSTPALPLKPDEKRRNLTRSLPEELNARALEQDMSWKQRADGFYLFRNNRWYRDDLLEAPEPAMRRLLALYPASEPVRKSTRSASPAAPLSERKAWLDWEAEVLKTLTPWQIANGLAWFTVEERAAEGGIKNLPDTPFPFFLDSERILREYNTVRFYAGLSLTGRTALLEGRLSYPSLSPAQQQQALYLLPALQSIMLNSSGTPILLGLRMERPKGLLVPASVLAEGAGSQPEIRLTLTGAASVSPAAP